MCIRNDSFLVDSPLSRLHSHVLRRPFGRVVHHHHTSWPCVTRARARTNTLVSFAWQSFCGAVRCGVRCGVRCNELTLLLHHSSVGRSVGRLVGGNCLNLRSSLNCFDVIFVLRGFERIDPRAQCTEMNSGLSAFTRSGVTVEKAVSERESVCRNWVERLWGAHLHSIETTRAVNVHFST